jgi:hypothetical protein
MNKGFGNTKYILGKNTSLPISLSYGAYLVALVSFNDVLKERMERRDEMINTLEPIIVEFPLRGEWLSPNTPGTRIPSHGTNRLGTRYAYDFIIFRQKTPTSRNGKGIVQ